MNQPKLYIKKILAAVGLYHPSLGIKISQERKAEIILEHKTPHLKTFVETGTNKGWMIERMLNRFERIYSVEFDDKLFNQAIAKFKGRSNLMLLKGDSAIEIKKIMEQIREPALFWLDAHGSGEISAENSPIIGEINAIFSHFVKNHVVIIDDARHFDRKTIQMIKKLAKLSNYTFAIESGIFRLYGRG